ncbi:MAG: ABC transporter permease, partial [Bacteroides sp.]|nr:ABC transporter permease [Bacteroides sp.]
LVCTMFLNYMLDLQGIKSAVAQEAAAFYDAQITTSKVVVIISGLCLLLTSIVTLLFYIKQYIEAHKKELGILKAIGYSDMKIAANIWVFGLSVLIGTAIGFALAYAVMPKLYAVQNKDGFLPDVPIAFHGELLAYFVLLPSIAFALFAVLFACYKLRRPVVGLIKDVDESAYKPKRVKGDRRDEGKFLRGLAASTLKSKKTLVFFMWFAAFCFAAMMQMGMSMRTLASDMMAAMIITLGAALACTTLLLAITTVINSNKKAIAIMRAYGYTQSECANAILGGYRPFAYLGFAVGTVYQYGILKIMVTFVFKDIANISYKFDFAVLGIALAIFAVLYEAITLLYANRIRKISLRQIMSE